jgi:hypothetical protein
LATDELSSLAKPPKNEIEAQRHQENQAYRRKDEGEGMKDEPEPGLSGFNPSGFILPSLCLCDLVVNSHAGSWEALDSPSGQHMAQGGAVEGDAVASSCKFNDRTPISVRFRPASARNGLPA